MDLRRVRTKSGRAFLFCLQSICVPFLNAFRADGRGIEADNGGKCAFCPCGAAVLGCGQSRTPVLQYSFHPCAEKAFVHIAKRRARGYVSIAKNIFV